MRPLLPPSVPSAAATGRRLHEGAVAARVAARPGRRWVASIAGALTALALSTGTPVLARGSGDDLPQVALSSLPSQAQRTKQLILEGGPFPYRKDGTVFFNRERLLPQHPRGYYREYTVPTPGIDHRGARRIVCGGEVVTSPRACYYTADHYASFARIVVDR